MLPCPLTVPRFQTAPVEPVFVSGSLAPGQPFSTYRIPAICRTKDGTLLAFAEGRRSVNDQAANVIVLRRKRARSDHWSPVTVVASSTPAALNNPCVLATRSGRVWLMYQRYPSGLSERTVQAGYAPERTCGSFVTWSDDDGLTWNTPRDVTREIRPADVHTVASGPGVGIELDSGTHKGRLVFPFNQRIGNSWTAFAAYSDDGGETWRRGIPAPKEGGTQPNEAQMAELSDGKVMLNARNQAQAHYRLTALSADGGESWSEATLDPDLPDPVCMGSLIRVSKVPNLLAFCNPGNQKKRADGVIRLSRDDGRTWQTIAQEQGSFAYSCLVPLPRARIGVLYESVTPLPNGGEGYRILYKELEANPPIK